jgi:hypothetical protein
MDVGGEPEKDDELPSPLAFASNGDISHIRTVLSHDPEAR